MGMAKISLVPAKRDSKTHRRTDEPRKSRAGTERFVSVDGEGITVDGVHKYTLLGVGQNQIENGNGLEWDEILEFLYSHYQKKSAYTGFFLGYDFTQWFSKLPEERANMLLTIEGRAKRKRKLKNGATHNVAPHSVEYQRWQFDILGSKRLRIRPKLCDCIVQSCPCRPKPPWMYICDAGGFFQTSLVKVIDPRNWKEPLVTPEEFNKIVSGKARRGSSELQPEDREYNRLENEILSRTLTELDRGFRQLGIFLSPSQWFGPGQAAQEWLKMQPIPTRTEMENLLEGWPQGLLEALRGSYFGGWFEIFIHGLIPGPSYEYDINNAYPYIISHLPCLFHGEWQEGIGRPDVGTKEYCLVQARVWSESPNNGYYIYDKEHYIGSMLHRDDHGRISRPIITEGWFWWHELEAARKAKCITRISGDRIFKWYKYIPCDCPPPAREMESLYLVRVRMGKDTAIGKAAKLVAVSAYGKFAQSVGHPLFGNPIYASLITAGTRAMILDAIATHPGGKAAVEMVATDGVFFLDPHPLLSISDKLGEWSYQERQNLTLFKPGVYWDDSTREQIQEGDNPVFKARGINAKAFASRIEEIDRQFRVWNYLGPPSYYNDDTDLKKKQSGEWPKVTYKPEFGMVSALQALVQGEWSRAGQLINYDIKPEENLPTQFSQPFDKRRVPIVAEEIPGRGGIYRSQPIKWGANTIHSWNLQTHKPYETFASVPYSKGFGYTDDEIEETQWGITPEGPIGMMFREALGLK
jgi:hypothetical protein